MPVLHLPLLAAGASAAAECPVHIFTDRGCTQKNYTGHNDIPSPEACCALCASLRNSTTTPCAAWTYHASGSRCMTAPYPTVVFGKDKISGSFVPTPAPGPAPAPPGPTQPPTPAPTPYPPVPPHPPSGSQPNIVLVLQDDQDIYMGGWTPMKQATALVGDKGATATNWFIHTPVCCPSRGEILSGRYFHSIRMPKSGGGCMHIDEGKVNPVSFAHYLGKAGYTMAYFGKHMNACPTEPPPGFDCDTCHWFAYGGDTVRYPNCSTAVPGGGCRGGGYVNAAFNDWYGGKPTPKGTTPQNPADGFYQADSSADAGPGAHAGYSASIVANKTIDWIKAVSKQPKPWMVVVGNRAPHAPFTPAPWYAEGSGPASAWIDGLAAPRTPDYNASCPEFHWLVAHQDIITPAQAAQTDNVFRNRWRALMSVDDGVAGISAAIDALGLSEKTYIFITSDHGWNLGQHRLPGGKHNVYDHSTRIPMVMRGPGIKAGTRFARPASNVDVAPTLLGLAGVDEYAAAMDGSSIVPYLVDEADPGVMPATRRHLSRHAAARARGGARPWRTFHPIEFAGLNNHSWFGHLIDDVVSNTYRALRFVDDPTYGDLLYAQFTGNFDWHFTAPTMHYELFNMTADPHQLVNLYYTMQKGGQQPMLDALQQRLEEQWACAGATCP